LEEEIIPLLTKYNIEYFNSVVDNWNEECYKEELRQRNICDFNLYVITSEMTGVYSIAEVIDDSNKKSRRTIFCFLEDGFDESQIKSLDKVGKMVETNGGIYFKSLDSVANYLYDFKCYLQNMS
jgi:predicted ferric reductase